MPEKGEQHLYGSAPEKNLSLIAALDALPAMTERSPTEIRELQLADEVLGPLMLAIEAKQKPDANTTRGRSRPYTLLLQQWDQLSIKMAYCSEMIKAHPEATSRLSF